MKYQYISLIICFSFLFNANLCAQWESADEEILLPNHRVWSIKIAQDSSIWAIATYDSWPPTNQTPKVFRSTNLGYTWSRSEIAEGVSNFGWDISPIDSLNAFVCLDTLGLFQTEDGGQSWNKVPSYDFSSFYVHFFNSDEGWVAGVDTTADRRLVMSLTMDGGQTWVNTGNGIGQALGTSVPTNTNDYRAFTYSVNSSYDVYENTIIIGRSAGNYWRSDDKGYNWTNHMTPLGELGILTSNVAMKDESTFMVAGDILESSFWGTETVNFTTTNGGATWDIVGSPGVTAAASHYIPNSDSIFIMAGHNDFGWGEAGTAISYDLGKSWSIIDGNSIIALDFLDENIGYGACCNNFWETANGQIHKWKFNLSSSTKLKDNPAVLNILPNPVNTYLEIYPSNEFKSSELRIEIMGVNGAIVFADKVQNSQSIKISTIDLPKGFYSIRISGYHKSATKKFIKK